MMETRKWKNQPIKMKDKLMNLTEKPIIESKIVLKTFMTPAHSFLNKYKKEKRLTVKYLKG